MTKITFGSDPEMFLVEKGTKNLVPPEYLIQFQGLTPIRVETNELGVRHPIFVETKDFSIIGDGALFEFILAPSKNILTVYKRFLLAMERLEKLGSKYGLEVLHSSIAKFDVDKYFSNMDSELVKESTIAGCDPDNDAIDDSYESKIRNLTHWNKRGAGGHIHLGVPDYPTLHEDIIPAIRLMAVTVGNTYIKNVVDLESEIERQEVFGKAGRFRTQPWGLEYRTPSNAWLLNEESVSQIAEACERAVYLLMNPKEGMEILDSYLKDSAKAINNVDIPLAIEILNEVM